MTPQLDDADVTLWENDIRVMIGETEPGEIVETIVWAAYEYRIDRPATPQDLVKWIRVRRCKRQDAALKRRPDVLNEQRNAVSDAAAGVIREWLQRNGGKGFENGYRRVHDDEPIEPTDEFYSTVYKRWQKVGKQRFRYKNMRRKVLAL
jgi:hypothetical protein